MSSFTRLTLIGSVRRAEIVVPSDEGVAALLPQLLELLEEPTTLEPSTVALVRPTGDQVDLALDCEAQELADGEVLRLVRSTEAPPPPDVADVTDVAAETFAQRPDRWSPASRRVVAACVVAAGTLLSGLDLVLRVVVPSPWLVPSLLAGLFVACLAVAAWLGRAGRLYPNLVLTAAGAGTVLPLVLSSAALWSPSPLALVWCSTAALFVALGVGVGLGRRDRGALAGAALGVVLAVAGVLLDEWVEPTRQFALLAASALLLCGLLPWYATSSSGLAALDDAVLDGTSPRLVRVRRSLADAYRALTWSTVAVTITLTVSVTGLLVLGGTLERWFALVVLVVLALRTRSLPLRAQVVLLWVAALVPLAAYALTTAPALGIAVGGPAAVGLLFALVAGAEPSGQQRARLRRLGDVVELLGVLAVIPLLLAIFDVYRDLLDTF